MPLPQKILFTEMEGEIQVKAKRYWSNRYGKIKNGIFMYYKNEKKIEPRRIVFMLPKIKTS